MQQFRFEPDEIRRRAIFIVEDVLETEDPTDIMPEVRSAAMLLEAAAAEIPWGRKGTAAAKRLARAMEGLTKKSARPWRARQEAVLACRAVYTTMPMLFSTVRRKANFEKA